MQPPAVPLPDSPLHALLASWPEAQRSALWLAGRTAAASGATGPSGHSVAGHSTGYGALDAELPDSGWPAAGLTELLFAAPGCGELRLLAPSLARPGPPVGSVLCVAPPFTPYAPALQALQLPLQRLVIVSPDNLADAAWAVEQGLRSGACAAVLWWQEAQVAAAAPAGRGAATSAPRQPARRGGEPRAPAAAARLSTALRRLHLASLDAACPLFALRPAGARLQSSPAPLRLSLEPGARGQLGVTVFKRRGPAMSSPLWLNLPVAGLPAQRSLRKVEAAPAVPATQPLAETADAVVRAAPERIAA